MASMPLCRVQSSLLAMASNLFAMVCNRLRALAFGVEANASGSFCNLMENVADTAARNEPWPVQLFELLSAYLIAMCLQTRECV